MARRPKKSDRTTGKPGRSPKAALPAEKPFFRPFAKLERASVPEADVAPARPAPRAAPGAAPPPEPGAMTEAETFAMFMAGVRTLEDRALRIPANATEAPRAARGAVPADDPDAPARASLRALVSDAVRFEVTDDGRHLEGRRVDLDPRELRRLRRGEHAVDGRLDLHGLGAGEAREALDAFVQKRRTDGDRVVLVVHGKGSHSPRGVGVLRGEIAAWLSQGRAARHVAAFTSTHDGRGGAAGEEGVSGALLVLLAR